MEDAEVVCKQLGCGSAVSAPGWAHFGEGSGPTWLIVPDCDGDESALWDCRHIGWGAVNYSHIADTGVICSGDSPLPRGGTFKVEQLQQEPLRAFQPGIVHGL
ncbi:unnamed protein product, partial [Eretmochelys imbricata]